MSPPADSVTIKLPRSAVPDVAALTATLLDRMHDLLERNTDGSLSLIEREELETLVHMAQFAQVLSIALQLRATP